MTFTMWKPLKPSKKCTSPGIALGVTSLTRRNTGSRCIVKNAGEDRGNTPDEPRD